MGDSTDEGFNQIIEGLNKAGIDTKRKSEYRLSDVEEQRRGLPAESMQIYKPELGHIIQFSQSTTPHGPRETITGLCTGIFIDGFAFRRFQNEH